MIAVREYGTYHPKFAIAFNYCGEFTKCKAHNSNLDHEQRMGAKWMLLELQDVKFLASKFSPRTFQR